MPKPQIDVTEYEPVEMLLARLTPAFNQSALAEQIGISPQYLSEILRRKRPPGDPVLDFLGLEKVVAYRPKSDGADSKQEKKTRARRR